MSGYIHSIEPNGVIMVYVESIGRAIPVTRMLANGDGNLKLAKSNGVEYESAGLSLAPKTMSGVDLCPHSSPACVFSCLNGTGNGSIFPMIAAARTAKGIVWNLERERAKQIIHDDIARHERRANKNGKRLCVRLNVFSDIAWETEFPELFSDYSDVVFYDYTKSPDRYGYAADNYWVTLSRSESNEEQCIEALNSGGNVAAVFHNNGPFVGRRSKYQTLPKTYLGFPVFDGDQSDRRFDDPGPGYWIGLTLKSANNMKRNHAIKTGFSVLTKGATL